MADETSSVLRLEVPCDPSGPSTARAALDDISGIERVRDDAKLIASELVTSAVKRARRAAGRIDVEVTVSAQFLLISVHDACGSPPEEPDPGSEGEPSGLSVAVLRELARRWGSEKTDGRRIWAELALAA